MTNSTNKPLKTLDIDDLDLVAFEPKSAKIKNMPITKTQIHDRAGGKVSQRQTVFPSREPILPKYQQLNMHIRSDVAERFKSLAVRDQYTTWKYGQIIEFLLDHYDKTKN